MNNSFSFQTNDIYELAWSIQTIQMFTEQQPQKNNSSRETKISQYSDDCPKARPPPQSLTSTTNLLKK